MNDTPYRYVIVGTVDVEDWCCTEEEVQEFFDNSDNGLNYTFYEGKKAIDKLVSILDEAHERGIGHQVNMAELALKEMLNELYGTELE